LPDQRRDVPSLDGRHEDDAAAVDVQADLGHEPLGQLKPAAWLTGGGHRSGLVADVVAAAALSHTDFDRLPAVKGEPRVERELCGLTPVRTEQVAMSCSVGHLSRLTAPRAAYAGWPMVSERIPCVLSIAGSDSGGGAGIQADLKAFARCGVHGMTALTAVTAQNTVAVTAVHPLPAEAIVEQVRAVAEDIGVDAVKIGMLGTAETIETVAGVLDLTPGAPVVLDPVMIAESGARLLDEDALDALRMRLLPRTTVVTPNLPEAKLLAGGSESAAVPVGATGTREPEALARAIHALGPETVVVTGGHREQAIDLFYDGKSLVDIPGERYPDGAAHGSGCTHSSALAAHLALGYEPLEAARRAKQVASEAVRDGLHEVGAGAGPVDVFGLAGRRAATPSVP
jgi:hydroxymethylpyrimidine/phosphomethylpyrimidine kinase